MKVALNTNKRKEDLRKKCLEVRNAEFEEPFVYLGKNYPSDLFFQDAIKTYLTAYSNSIIPVDNPVKIRRTDNSFWYPNRSELLPFAAALMAHVQGIWDRYWAAKDSI